MTRIITEEEEIQAAALAWNNIVELVYKSPYVPVSELRPSKKQVEFLAYDGDECLYGGGVGGGKSDALLMAALMYVSVPGYSALLLRRTYRQLAGDGGLIPRSKEWIGNKAQWREKSMQWTFPSGATITFGYFDHADDRNLYLGGAWQFCGWDEATLFKPEWYEFMFSRLRKPDWICTNCKFPLKRANFTVQEFHHKPICKNCRQPIDLATMKHKTEQRYCDKPELPECDHPIPVSMPTNHLGMSLADVPIRVRAASNPGSIGHDYFKRRFVVQGAPKRFVKSLLDDNPGLDKEDYKKKLDKLDPITKAQYLNGDWDAYQGGRFKKSWFREFWIEPDRNANPVYVWENRDTEGVIHNGWPTCPYGGIPVSLCWNLITVDPAASVDDANDYTVIGVFAVTPTGEIFTLEIVRERLAIEQIVPRIEKLCGDYSPQFVGIEDVAFQLGIVREGQRSLGVAVERLKPEGKGKLVRATPAIIRASEGQIFIPKDEPQGSYPWLADYLAELVQFTGDDSLDSFDDVVDVLSYCVASLAKHGLACPIVIQPSEEEYAVERELGIFMSNG
jgi:predicted phage terminase large subunit-like protein